MRTYPVHGSVRAVGRLRACTSPTSGPSSATSTCPTTGCYPSSITTLLCFSSTRMAKRRTKHLGSSGAVKRSGRRP